EGRFVACQDEFAKIPGAPVAYWVSEAIYSGFDKFQALIHYAMPKQGMSTANNNLFLRYWFEPMINNISFDSNTICESIQSKRKWFPHTKGGEFRKWYGNNEYIVNWYNDGYDIRNYSGSAPRSSQLYFREGLCWSTLTAGLVSFRYTPSGYTMNTKGSLCYMKKDTDIYTMLAFLNSTVAMRYLSLLAPTLDYSQGPVGNLPVAPVDSNKELVDGFVRENISISRADWDSFETSWDFKRHPLI
ncbi:MAG: hypothetical protein RSF35_09655, partial [Akkermansia sp.]